MNDDYIRRFLIREKQQTMKINIIGGGITGLATGLALQKNGLHDFCIHEKAAQLNEVGAGIVMQPNAMKILDWLGIGLKVRNAGMPIHQADITDQQFKSLRRPGKESMSIDRSNNVIAIHRARLQGILYEALPASKVKLDMPFVDCQYEGRQVKAIFPQSNLMSDILLGADGIHSPTRQKLFPSSSLRYSGQTCWRGIAQWPLAEDLLSIAKEAWGPGLRFGYAGISPTEVYWFAVAKAAPGGRDNHQTVKAELRTRFKEFHPLVTSLLDHTDDDKIIRSDIHDLQRLETWHQDRICLLGDAAHATTPNLGQGACQGIEDAFYLSHLLDSETDYRVAFQVFEEDRRKKVDYIVNTSWTVGKMAHHPVGQPLMKMLMRLTPERTVMKQMQKLFELKGEL